MRRIAVLALLLSTSALASAQQFEENATPCIETAELGLWSPWVEYDETQFSGQWFRAEGSLGGKCTSGGKYFVEGKEIESGQTLDLRVLGIGSHFLTAKLKPFKSGEATIRRVWHVQVTRPGDINGDGEVSFSDFLMLARDYGAAGRQNGDLDYSGEIGFPDFLILSRNFGQDTGTAPESVPEPSCAFFAWLMIFAISLLRSKRSQ